MLQSTGHPPLGSGWRVGHEYSSNRVKFCASTCVQRYLCRNTTCFKNMGFGSSLSVWVWSMVDFYKFSLVMIGRCAIFSSCSSYNWLGRWDPEYEKIWVAGAAPCGYRVSLTLDTQHSNLLLNKNGKNGKWLPWKRQHTISFIIRSYHLPMSDPSPSTPTV